MAAAANGDRQHLLEIYDLHRKGLFACALAVTRCPEAAEDAVHDAFVKLARRPFHADNPRAYVFRAVRNAAVDTGRRNIKIVGEPEISVIDESPGPGELASETENRARIAAALAQLRDDERETIVQHLWCDLTFREIAEIQGRPIGTVTAWYRRGVERLRVLIKER